jgi:hypothetical protein
MPLWLTLVTHKRKGVCAALSSRAARLPHQEAGRLSRRFAGRGGSRGRGASPTSSSRRAACFSLFPGERSRATCGGGSGHKRAVLLSPRFLPLDLSRRVSEAPSGATSSWWDAGLSWTAGIPLDRASSAFQAEGRGFESRLPLTICMRSVRRAAGSMLGRASGAGTAGSLLAPKPRAPRVRFNILAPQGGAEERPLTVVYQTRNLSAATHHPRAGPRPARPFASGCGASFSRASAAPRSRGASAAPRSRATSARPV